MVHLTLLVLIHSFTQQTLNEHPLCTKHYAGCWKKTDETFIYSYPVAQPLKRAGKRVSPQVSMEDAGPGVGQCCGEDSGFLRPAYQDWTPAPAFLALR